MDRGAGRVAALDRATDPVERGRAEDAVRSLDAEVRVGRHPAPRLALAASILAFLATSAATCLNGWIEAQRARGSFVEIRPSLGRAVRGR